MYVHCNNLPHMNPKLKRTINPYKKRFFKFLTSSFKNSRNISELSQTDKKNIKRILVTRPNHRLGNQLLITPLIKAIENEFPSCKVDLLVNGTLSNIIFENYKSVDKIYTLPKKPFKNLLEYIKISLKVISSQYDIAIVGIETSNSSRIFVKLSNSKFKIFSSINNNPPVHIAKIPVDSLKSVSNPNHNDLEFPKLDIKLSKAEIEKGSAILSNYFKDDRPVISIFTNATGRKKLSKAWWKELCDLLEIECSEAHIFEILPKENTSQVDFEYKSFLSNDIREMAAVIENCTIFIGADSGVMHLATATNSTTFGLFNGISNAEVYGPYGKNKFTVETHKVEIKNIVEDIKKFLVRS